MKFWHPFCEIPVHPVVFVQPFSEHRISDSLTAGQNQSRIVLSRLQDKVRALLIEMISLHPAQKVGAAHGGHDDAVFDFTVSNLPGGE